MKTRLLKEVRERFEFQIFKKSTFCFGRTIVHDKKLQTFETIHTDRISFVLNFFVFSRLMHSHFVNKWSSKKEKIANILVYKNKMLEFNKYNK